MMQSYLSLLNETMVYPDMICTYVTKTGCLIISTLITDYFLFAGNILDTLYAVMCKLNDSPEKQILSLLWSVLSLSNSTVLLLWRGHIGSPHTGSLCSINPPVCTYFFVTVCSRDWPLGGSVTLFLNGFSVSGSSGPCLLWAPHSSCVWQQRASIRLSGRVLSYKQLMPYWQITEIHLGGPDSLLSLWPFHRYSLHSLAILREHAFSPKLWDDLWLAEWPRDVFGGGPCGWQSDTGVIQGDHSWKSLCQSERGLRCALDGKAGRSPKNVLRFDEIFQTEAVFDRREFHRYAAMSWAMHAWLGPSGYCRLLSLRFSELLWV